jgi:hypothetical protein
MRILAIVTMGLLAACSSEAPPTEAPAETAKALTSGEYEVSGKIETLRSTDGTTPATKAKLGDPPVLARACVAADGTMEPMMFGEPGDKCKAENAYARNGRLNLQLSCTREGAPGQVMQTINGSFTSESFVAEVTTGTYFSGSGDYSMKRTLAGKRVGECPAASAKS